MNNNSNTTNKIRAPNVSIVGGGVLAADAKTVPFSDATLEKISKQEYDIVIYEATPGGIACAVRAARARD